MSKETYDKVLQGGLTPAVILTNPIDTRTFHPTPLQRQGPAQRVMLLANVTEHVSKVAEAAERMGMEFEHVGGFARLDPPIVAERMRQNDIVVSVGRGVYEALCVGKRVIVANVDSMEGAVSSRQMFLCSRLHNCSGRGGLKRTTTVANLMDSLEWIVKADERELKRLTSLVREDYEARIWICNLLNHTGRVRGGTT